jgi:hypothetical protein
MIESTQLTIYYSFIRGRHTLHLHEGGPHIGTTKWYHVGNKGTILSRKQCEIYAEAIECICSLKTGNHPQKSSSITIWFLSLLNGSPPVKLTKFLWNL